LDHRIKFNVLNGAFDIVGLRRGETAVEVSHLHPPTHLQRLVQVTSRVRAFLG